MDWRAAVRGDARRKEGGGSAIWAGVRCVGGDVGRAGGLLFGEILPGDR